MEARSLYENLIIKFPEGEMGIGLEPTFPGISFQPMTYGLLLSSEAIYYKKLNNKSSINRIRELTDWLIENNDLDKDGIPGWGLPHAWDAFQDGSINPPNHPYTITTSIVMNGFLDALSVQNVVPNDKKKKIRGLLAKVTLYWCKYVWTSSNEGGYFWYSPRKEDSHFTVNVSAMFLGTLARLLAEQGDIFTKKESLFVQDRMDAAAKSIISNAKLNKGLPKWYYTIQEDPKRRGKFNDIVHHGYILWGLESYRTHGGKHQLPWTSEQSVESMNSFIMEDQVLRFQNNRGPARLWGAGMALAFYAKYAHQEKVNHLIQIIDKEYGPFPDLLYYPNDKDKSFYPRFAAHVLWGLALSI
ncbi:hypothetical protein [Neobacillus sp. PS2-9]|uniref:hypothetical protein n=1 Tax=Neobacillus sp. PS2-9 TaxID=3070676 RepID=UPI0027DF421E|nr:hypothetical protein [Neobacillus sp. PS2-9]WML58024.1 hypothetical protein RCG25_24635 [Neobacillus sp. PS2-9]